jgi:hypothetical protein
MLLANIEVIHFDKHRKVKEVIMEGPHGAQAIILSIKDNVHFEEEVKKAGKVENVGEGSHSKNVDHISESVKGSEAAMDGEGGAPARSGGEHHHNHHLEHEAS